MSGQNICFICEKTLNEGETLEVKARGLNSLKESSVRRKDNKVGQLRGLNSVIIHVKCHKTYTRERSIIAAIRANTGETSGTVRRSNLLTFEWKTKCLFCAQDASEQFLAREQKNHVDKRDSVGLIQTLNMNEKLEKIAGERNDSFSEKVVLRIKDVDLVAAEGRYHTSCLKRFFARPPSTREKGRPENEDVVAVMNHIFSYIEEHREECQFSVKEILVGYEGNLPTNTTIINKLEKKYGEDMIITAKRKSEPIISFRDTGHKILTKHWYENQEENVIDERLRIVKAAAQIITEDIRSRVYETKQYSASETFLANIESDIPETLKALLHTIITKNKRGEQDKWNAKITAIAHAIIAAARPKSFLSSLQIGLGAFFSRKYGSKDLLKVLSALGFCASYEEIVTFETSALFHPQKTIMNNSFSQFVFDNADVNINTIDGLNTFHTMGGIQCVTPSTTVSSDGKIKRLSNIPRAHTIGQFGNVPLRTFHKTGNNGLTRINIKDLNEINPISSRVSLLSSDFFWLYGKTNGMPTIPGWNGYMEQITSHMIYSKSRLLYLPFVKAPPSNHDTIYTVLLNAAEKCKSLGQSSCFVTFDQPLYIKARDIIASVPESSDLSAVIVRLGGFHLLMSFMGSIGYIMDGSGLRDLFNVVYATASTEKMLTGHAYARALRAHILAHVALAKIVFSAVGFTTEERADMEDALSNIGNPLFLNRIEGEHFEDTIRKFTETLNGLAENGPTAKLWVQYFDMVTLVKQFIQAERTGNWDLHLKTIQRMLPYFHASGHFLYAKSAQLYLQDMLDLRTKMTPMEYSRFVNEGYFTIRRSEKFWCGIWSDMTIEQTLMRSMKSTGGLTHGRGITDSVLAKWILAMPVLAEVSEAIENFCSVSFATSEQHVDARVSRISRDTQDLEKFVDWFSSHNPFPVSLEIMSISTGVQGDVKIDCYRANEVGVLSMAAIVGGNFGDVKFQRKKRVIPLRAVNSSLNIQNEVVPVDPSLIFQRITIAKKTEQDLQQYFHFELAPYPLSLFDEIGMRKTKKSSLYNMFSHVAHPINDADNVVHVIDGGFLLHRVVWYQQETFDNILSKQGKQKFVKLLQKNMNLPRTVGIFKDPNASPDLIEAAGKSFIRALYGASGDTSLNDCRFQCFTKSISKSACNLASLPPTEAAARQHSFRTYHQIQEWYGNKKSPQDWGWKSTRNGLTPIPTLIDAAPQELLSTISCKCKQGCRAACSCRKTGLRCSIICGSCRGQSCTNVDIEEENFDVDDDDVHFEHSAAQDIYLTDSESESSLVDNEGRFDEREITAEPSTSGDIPTQDEPFTRERRTLSKRRRLN
ncbi:unnamed protein product [Phaedon cochleariae]|uniref:Tesmin/TSO1-like CXC domain-containing protein n=1 Tax=Phaedon cochleariae TaxID=80249 RepID=A0A9P0GPY2_PHACE|nr:unnamed protein product [Phaedon cochleariae]